MTREMGFSCDCSGVRTVYLLDLIELRELVPQTRREVANRFGGPVPQFYPPPGSKKRKLEAARAKKRSYALLCQHLTKEQRRMMRGAKCFYVQGADGQQYLIESEIHGNLFRIDPETGIPDERYCVSPSGVPVYDVMLAQKLYLETQPKLLLGKANKLTLPGHPPATATGLEGGGLDISDEHIENPDRWMRRRMGNPTVYIDDLLANDVLVQETHAHYDTVRDDLFKGCALYPNGDVLPYFDDSFEIPKLPPDTDMEEAFVKLVLGYPLVECEDWGIVMERFNERDLNPYVILGHPRTEFSGFPTWLFRYTHKSFPLGKVYFIPDPQFTGIRVRWADESGVGIAIICTVLATMEANCVAEFPEINESGPFLLPTSTSELNPSGGGRIQEEGAASAESSPETVVGDELGSGQRQRPSDCPEPEIPNQPY